MFNCSLTKEECKSYIENMLNASKHRPQDVFANYIQKEYIDCSPEEGWIDFRFIPEKKHENPIGSVHGGVCAGILDECMAWTCAVFVIAGSGRDFSSVVNPTVDMQLNYFKQVCAGDIIRVHSRIIHAGKRIVTLQGEMWRGDELCVSATETMTIVKIKK